jgi:hypothetical protein
MTPSLNSQSFKSAPLSLHIDDTVREVVAAMPIVIFASAIREAFLGRRQGKPALVATRTVGTR